MAAVSFYSDRFKPDSERAVERTRSSSGRKITHPATAAPAGSNRGVNC
jgi:hypothetical protein